MNKYIFGDNKIGNANNDVNNNKSDNNNGSNSNYIIVMRILKK